MKQDAVIPNRPPASGILGLCPWLALAGGLALAACQWLIFVYAPTEASLGLPQKIFYLHMPLAWWGLISFFVVFAASAMYLFKGNEQWDALAGAAAEVGLLLASLALIAGCVWAKTSWGVWWTWDPKLATTLIMCFIYAGYLIVRNMDLPAQRRAQISAVLGIVAFLDVPLVFFSAKLWSSYAHPASIGLEPEMKLTLFACIGAFALFWAGLTGLRWKIILDGRRLDALAMERLMRREQHRDTNTPVTRDF